MADKTIFELLDIDKPERQVIEPEKKQEIVVKIDSENEDQFDMDFTQARSDIQFAIELAKNAANDLALIARESEMSPKNYEALDRFLRTIADSSSVLLNIHERRKKHKFKSIDKNEKNGISVNNAVFVGSSTELRKLMKDDQSA